MARLIKNLASKKTVWMYASILVFIIILDKIYRDNFTWSTGLLGIFFIYILSYCLFFVSTTIFKAFMSLVIFISFIALDFFGFQHYPVHPSMTWMLLRQASAKEILFYLDVKLIVSIVVLIFLLVLLWKKTPARLHPLSKFWQFTLLLGFTILLPLFYVTLTTYATSRSLVSIPYVLFHRSRIFMNPTSHRTDYINQLQYKNKPLHLILHIGETVRADHLSINGYARNTTPHLKNHPIINFGITKSCQSFTLASWIYLNTPIDCTDDFDSVQQKTLPFYFGQVGYKTLMTGENDELSVYNVVQDSQTSKKIQFFEQNIYKAYHSLTTKTPREFLILNSYGSHLPYQTIPKDFQPFSPTCNGRIVEDFKECGVEKSVNSYDNTIRFLDLTISQVIKEIEHSNVPTVYIYTSDHGEDLFDGSGDQYIGHSTKSIENRMVPFFIYTNTSFKNTYPEKYSSLVKNSKYFQNQLTHEVIWHSVMDIGGFTNKKGKTIIDYSRSIFSSQLRPRVKPDWFQVDYQRN